MEFCTTIKIILKTQTINSQCFVIFIKERLKCEIIKFHEDKAIVEEKEYEAPIEIQPPFITVEV